MARDFCGAFADFGAAEEWLRRLAADTPPAAFEAGGSLLSAGWRPAEKGVLDGGSAA